jgi:hypothetical protein
MKTQTSPKIRERTLRRRRARQTAEHDRSENRILSRAVVLGLLLVVGTFVLYGSVGRHNFLHYDDNVYVLDNPHVTAGLSWDTVQWSLTSMEHANWHPLTWLSHALDCQLFGLDAGAHHLVSVFIHALNVLLLFLFPCRLTGEMWRGFLVAALFAFHPFNVESVAWVAERKNLLSMLFLLLTPGAYGWYARNPRWKRLAVVCGIFTLALASKPMAVTLPFVLLLLDYWPLQRLWGWTKQSLRLSTFQEPIWPLLPEKWPLYFLSALSCVITIHSQGRAVRSLQVYPLSVRISNALDAYALYLWNTVWPHGLAVYYPFTLTSLSLWKTALTVLFLSGISVVAWRQRQTRPYLLVGWLWFLGTLVPVIGIVQVGDQSMADRYVYLPLVGLFVAIVWFAAEACDSGRVSLAGRSVAALATLGALSLLTVRQLSYWKDDVTLWSHTVQVTPQNETAESQLAAGFLFRRDHDSALPHLINVARLDPMNISPHGSIGAGYMLEGQLPEAIHELETVVRLSDHTNLSPRDRDLRASALVNLGFAAILMSDYTNALTRFQQADQVDSVTVDQAIQEVERSIASEPTGNSYLELPLLLRAKGKDKQALSILAGARSVHIRITTTLVCCGAS